jgi:hypothetical protein
VAINQWLIDEQIKRLQWHRIPDKVECYCTISGHHVFPALELIHKLKWMRILEWEELDPHGEFEGRTLKYLYRDAAIDDKIFYFHTKGISFLSQYRRWGNGTMYSFNSRNVKAISSWRLCMETSLIDVWTQRVQQLDHCDSLGCYYLDDPFPHYMGNFWWASGRHIRRLKHPFEFEVVPYPNMNIQECIPARIRYEQWLFSGAGYHIPVRNWPWHISPEMREPGYSPGVNPYEDDFAAYHD